MFIFKFKIRVGSSIIGRLIRNSYFATYILKSLDFIFCHYPEIVYDLRCEVIFFTISKQQLINPLISILTSNYRLSTHI